MSEPFFENRIVTRSMLGDMVERVRNQVGLRQRGYEEMVDEAATELVTEVHDEYDVDWYRVDVDMMGRGAVAVTVYGQGDPS
jgi:hypothetical protein